MAPVIFGAKPNIWERLPVASSRIPALRRWTSSAIRLEVSWLACGYETAAAPTWLAGC